MIGLQAHILCATASYVAFLTGFAAALMYIAQERQFGSEYASLTRLMQRLRPVVKRRVTDAAQRRRVFQRLTGQNVLTLLKRGQTARVRRMADRLMTQATGRR